MTRYRAKYHPSVFNDLNDIEGMGPLAVRIIKKEILGGGNPVAGATEIGFLTNTYSLLHDGLYVLFYLNEALSIVYVLAVRKEGESLKKQNPPQRAGFQVSHNTNKQERL